MVGMSLSSWRTPWARAQGSKFRPNFCNVRPRTSRGQLLMMPGCAFIPLRVRMISPSSAIRAERASARSKPGTLCQHLHAGGILNPIFRRRFTPKCLAVCAKRPRGFRARLSRVQRGPDVEEGRTFSFGKTYPGKYFISPTRKRPSARTLKQSIFFRPPPAQRSRRAERGRPGHPLTSLVPDGI